MKAHTSDGVPVRIEQVVTIGLVATRPILQKLIATSDKPIPVLHIYGYINEYAVVESRTEGRRPTTYIKGALSADALFPDNHNKYITGQIILPDSASAYICAKIDELGPLDIDLTLEVMPAEKSITGYRFNCLLNSLAARNKPLLDTQS